VIAPHDDYFAIYQPINTENKNEALGKGMAILCNTTVFAHQIEELMTDKTAAYRI